MALALPYLRTCLGRYTTTAFIILCYVEPYTLSFSRYVLLHYDHAPGLILSGSQGDRNMLATLLMIEMY